MPGPGRGRRPRRGYVKAMSVVAGAGLVGGVAVAVAGAASPAGALTVNKSLNVTCVIPVAGAQPYTAQVTATVPDDIHAGVSFSLQDLAIKLQLSSVTTDALQILNAATLQGSISLGAAVSGATPSSVSLAASIPSTPIPQDVDANGEAPAFAVTATSATSPTLSATADSVSVSGSSFTLYLDPQDATGTSVLPVAKRTAACSFDAGQDLALIGTTPPPTPTPPGSTPAPATPVPSTPTPPTPTVTPPLADRFSATLNVTCQMRVAGSVQWPITITGFIPRSPRAGDTVQLSDVTIQAMLSVTTADALQVLGATTIQGTFNFGATLPDASPAALTAALPVPETAVPQTSDMYGDAPEFALVGQGGSTTAKINTFDAAVLSASTFSAYLEPHNADGTNSLPVTARNIPCTFDTGQDLTLARITPGGGDPSPTPVANTPTPTPTPVSTGTPIPHGSPSPSPSPSPLPGTPTPKPTGPTPTAKPPTPSPIPTLKPSPTATPKPATPTAAPTVKPTAAPTVKPATPTPKPATPSPKPATPAPTPVQLNYAVTGTLGIPTVSGTGTIPSGVIKVQASLAARTFTGAVTLPNVTINGKLFGFVPITVVTSFSEVGPLTGTIAPGARDLTADVKTNIGVVSAKAGGLSLTTGNCATASPISAHLASNGRGQFDAFTGGAVTGTFAIGKLTNCGPLTDLLNTIVPGPNNTLALTLVGHN